MKLFPYMSGGGVASKTPVYAFGESYGGSYVISLSKVYLNYRYTLLGCKCTTTIVRTTTVVVVVRTTTTVGSKKSAPAHLTAQ